MTGNRHSLFRRPSVALASVAVLTLTVAACGDDDAAEPAADDTAVDATAVDGTAADDTVDDTTEGTSAGSAPSDTTGTTAAGEPTGGDGLQVLFGSSGEAETAAIIASAERFTEATGTPVDVIPAQDLRQQLTQAFAGGSPPDVFYLSPEETRTFQDSLFPYGDQIEDIDDFYPALIESYTIDDQLYCVPKDFSNLALVINTTAWEAAGLTEDDIPTTWDELTAVSTQLTSGEQTGLVFGGEFERVGAFLRQAGGWIVNEDMTEATAESEANEEALTYVQDNVLAGNFQYAAQVEAGWGGEAFGSGKGAMTIEGPWIVGALQNDFPDVSWQAAELPEGPAGPGTLTFSNCWGVAADGDTANAVELVRHFASPEEQQTFTEAFGVNPSRISLEEWNAEAQPEKAAFNAGIDYAQGQVEIPGFAPAIADLNAQLESLGNGTATPDEVLERLQQTTEEVIADQGS